MIDHLETWYWLDSGPCGAAFNMALDEALLEAVTRLGRPVLRFYGWTEPAATFGYSQAYETVEQTTPLRPLIRRPTGGGIVPHDRDWTYSLAFPADHAWHQLRARESYRQVHEWVQAAFANVGETVTLAPAAVKVLPGQCFVGCEESDLLWRGQKIAGAAQRRTKLGLLIQGSVHPVGAAPDRARWQTAMRETGPPNQACRWEEWTPDDGVRSRSLSLAQEKYGREQFNRQRKTGLVRPTVHGD